MVPANNCFKKPPEFSISLNNFQSWVLAKSVFGEFFVAEYLEIPWHFLNAPLFFLFLVHYLKMEEKYYTPIKIIFAVFIVLVLVRIGLLYFYNNDELKVLLNRYTVAEEFLSIISSLVIFMFSFYVFQKEKSSNEIIKSYNLKWLTNFFYISAFAYLFWLIPLIILTLNITK